MAKFNAWRGAIMTANGRRGAGEVRRLADLSSEQWRSGIAAWLGWLFDGLDMHLYVLVASPFVAELIGAGSEKDPAVGFYSSWIQAAFLIGWALGGGLFGLVGDRLGRSRALMLTISTYAMFTGLSFFAQTWWQLLIFRFLAALGIGGEWAVGATLLSETWPRSWRPWLAAVLQTAVNVGVMVAALVAFVLSGPGRERYVFLVGVVPALLVVWIRKAVPESAQWERDKAGAAEAAPRFRELFRGSVWRVGSLRRTTVLTLTVCALSLSAHWAFLFWFVQYMRNLPDLNSWDDGAKGHFVAQMYWLVIGISIFGNFFAAWLARWLKYRRAIALLCLCYGIAMVVTFGVARLHDQLWIGFTAIGICQGVFALFTMYLPPLFPTLLRTTGAGFCYNISRIAAGLGTVAFGLSAPNGDHRLALFYAGFLFFPAAAVAWILPDISDEQGEPLSPVRREQVELVD
ncbi:MAG TPA: MFS transporter [Pirellulales bacterium]|nr:MFS transporter [Pirellulales bacterium]